MTRQNATLGPTKYALARRLLARCALANFSHAASVHGIKILVNYAKCIQAVTLAVILQKALQDQKRWMRYFLKKPQDMPVWDYIAWVIEINYYLTEFPPTAVGGDSTKLPDNELLDLLEFGILISWQWKMQIQNFVPTAGTIRDFQDFCERLEDALNESHGDPKPNKTSNKEKGNKKHRHNNNNNEEIFF